MNLKKTALVCGVALSLLSLSSFNTVASASNKHYVTYSKLSKKNNKNVKSLNKKLRALKKQYKHANKHQRKILKKQINKLEHEIKTINKNNSHKKNNVSVNDQKLDNTNNKSNTTKNNGSGNNGILNTALYDFNSNNNSSEQSNKKTNKDAAAKDAAAKEKQAHIDAYNAQHPANAATVNAYNKQHQANVEIANAKQDHINEHKEYHAQRENDPVLTAKYELTQAKKAVKDNKDQSALADLKQKEENARKNYETVVSSVAATKAAKEKQTHINEYKEYHAQRENDPVLTAKYELTQAKKAVKDNKDQSALADLKQKEENARKNYETVVSSVAATKAAKEK